MSPEFIEKWEKLLEDVDKQKIPIRFVKKIVIKMIGKKQHTVNIERLMSKGLEPEDVEEIISSKLMELDDYVTGIEFVLNVETIADTVQPETDRLLSGL